VEEGVVMACSRIPLLVAVIVAFPACFDVSSGDKTPLLIDNFDSGGVLPADRHFDQWSCMRYEPASKQDCDCYYDDSTYHSRPYSLTLNATIVETGTQNKAGAQLYTQVTAPEDVSHRKEIVFSARYDKRDPPLPKDARLYVELYCLSGIVTARQSAGDNWRSDDWQTFVLQLSMFGLDWENRDEKLLTACLEQITSIHFSVNGGLGLGATGSFVLHIDDVYFR
jgi:hypothetical protein